MTAKMTSDYLKNLFGGDWDMALAVIESFFRTMADLDEKLRAAESNWDDKTNLKQTLHAIKGALSVFSESAVFEKAKFFNELLKVNPDSFTKAQGQELRQSYLDLQSELRRLLKPE